MSQYSHYPNRAAERRTTQRRTLRNTALLGGATALIGTGIGVTANAIHNQGHTISHLRHESTAKTESLAAAQAASFTAALYDAAQYPKGVQMPVLNGEIRTTVKSPDGATHTGTYKDPILLATDDIDAKPDLKGNFLKGGWIGIVGSDANGHAVIRAERYNDATETFKPYTSKPTDLIFRDLGVYATTVTNGPDELIGFNIYGEQPNPTNPDGTIVSPGLSSGMK